MFDRIASWVSDKVGTGTAFAIASTSILVWLATGPILKFSNTWQLIINTGTTVITWLMLFLLQHTQNRDTRDMKRTLASIEQQLGGGEHRV